MEKSASIDFALLYSGFQAPITALNCGERCSPHNEHGVPFCCDTRHAIPAAYRTEWTYLKTNTNLWHPWQGTTPPLHAELSAQVPSGQILIACLGHTLCQRDFRSLSCRSFPFFPYVTRQGEFIGLSYIWEYEDRCWVVSNLQLVSLEYLVQFIRAFEALFERMPEELEVFRAFSSRMRRIFGRRHRSIPLLHRNRQFYKVTPHNGRLRRVHAENLPKFGVYKIAERLPFPDEVGT